MSAISERSVDFWFPLPGRGDHSEEVLRNKYGIVIPPSVSECVGDLCLCKASQEENCAMNTHHLHSTHDSYFYDGRIAHKFRNLPALTIWTPECRHQIYHEIHEIDIPVPHPDVMRQCIREA